MLPITRANLDNICCTCLVDIRPTNPTNKKVYIIQENIKLLKVLKVTAYVSVLKDPLNLKYINDYCRKVCQICFLKAQYSYNFIQKIIDSTTRLKDLLKSDSNSTIVDVNILKDWCRICLNRQRALRNEDHNKYIKWLKMFSGIENDELLNSNEHCPKQLCGICLEKLRNVEEYWLLSTYSFKHIASEIDKDCGSRVDTKDKVYNESQEKQTFIENENLLSQSFNKDVEIFTNPYPVEEVMPNYETECTQMQETIIWNNQNLDNLDSIKHSISETRGKPMDSQYQVDDFIISFLSTTDASTAHLDKNTIDNNDDINSVRNDEDRDHDFTATDTEGSSLTDYDDVIGDIKKCPPKQSKQKNEIKRKSTRKIQEQIKAERNKRKLNKKKEIFECKICFKILCNKNVLRRHERIVHFTSLEKHEPTEAEVLNNTCHICSKYFKQKHHLRQHIRAVHEKQKPFKCSYCSDTFTTNSSRRAHERLHSGEFPFVCKWCQRGFRKSHLLEIHVERHTAIPELLCPICKRAQSTKEELTKHLKMHDEKRSQCPSCGKLFNTIRLLKNHQNLVHLKLRPFKCQFCNMAFANRTRRRIHEKSHTEERPVACSVCGRGFKLHSSVTRHLKYCNSNINPNNISKDNQMDTSLKT